MKSCARTALVLLLAGAVSFVSCAPAHTQKPNEQPTPQQAGPQSQPQTGQEAAEPSPELVTPTDEQHELNTTAVEAMIEEKYARAAALLEQSVLLGEINVTYLNLGRAYQKLEKCERARSALEKALVAPRVSKPAPELVEERARAYLDELEASCGPAPSADQTDEKKSEQKSAPKSDQESDQNKRDEPEVPVSF